MIELSRDQQQAFQEGRPVRLQSPELGQEAILCPVGLFEKMQAQLREFSEDEKEQEAWLKMSRRTLARRLQEDENDQPG